ncbi:hypothetical protein L1285_09395 [Pseudoalteromonas sp. DL2-H2.2]|uniref:hypothetical protein n=1 Tax=Pseudoalteromonas sp. DL2-H2.2 TaxID=2908889 RepID=UPI001F481D78|nr:hypothetical protein [Pseudoalteromonas sp. DL2-H2.2]MCF2908539.1 hypothetical protein [Pseudoalteromonas sp. DL2-H2.2]
MVLDALGYRESVLNDNYNNLEQDVRTVFNGSEWNKSTLSANTKKINDILREYKDKITNPKLKAKAKDTFSFSEFGDDTAAKEAMKSIFKRLYRFFSSRVDNFS